MVIVPFFSRLLSESPFKCRIKTKNQHVGYSITREHYQFMKFDPFLLWIIGLFDQAAGHGDITIAKQQQGFGCQAIAAGFLAIPFNVFGDVVTNDKFDI